MRWKMNGNIFGTLQIVAKRDCCPHGHWSYVAVCFEVWFSPKSGNYLHVPECNYLIIGVDPCNQAACKQVSWCSEWRIVVGWVGTVVPFGFKLKSLGAEVCTTKCSWVKKHGRVGLHWVGCHLGWSWFRTVSPDLPTTNLEPPAILAPTFPFLFSQEENIEGNVYELVQIGYNS